MSNITQAQLDSVAHLSSREAGKVLGVGKSTVNRYREVAKINGGFVPQADKYTGGNAASLSTKFDGSLEVESAGPVPQSKGEIDDVMRGRGFDPDLYDFTYRFSSWEAPDGEGGVRTMYAARAGATPKRLNKIAEALDVTELLDAVRDWTFTPVYSGRPASADFVLAFADPQIGKVDVNGGTVDTTEQVMQSFQNAVEICKEEKPSEIIFADLGDGLENFQNTSSQRETNDVDLTGQVRILRRLQAEGLRMLAPYAPRITHASVPSNHGQVRIAPQAQASTASNDWGLEVSHQLQDVFEESKFKNIRFIRPAGDHDVSLGYLTENETRLGFTHGDTAGSQNRLGTWWMGQAFGWDNALRNTDILLVGHFHNQGLEEVYEGRFIIPCASSDRGSAWFTNRTGRSASSGMTSFLTADRKFWRLELI